MIVKIPTNPEELKNFLIKYIGKILPDAEAESMREFLKCKNITYQIYDKIMLQYKKVVKRGKKPQIKLDGGSKKRTKRSRKSKKRRLILLLRIKLISSEVKIELMNHLRGGIGFTYLLISNTK